MFELPKLMSGEHALRARESTVRYVFGLIWPMARIDCCEGADCYLVGVCEGLLRHVIRVPRGLVDFDEGLLLVRAVYKAGVPALLLRASSPRSVSL